MQDVGPADLLVEYSITFPTEDIYDAFRLSDGVDRLDRKHELSWNQNTRTVTYSWKRRRR